LISNFIYDELSDKLFAFSMFKEPNMLRVWEIDPVKHTMSWVGSLKAHFDYNPSALIFAALDTQHNRWYVVPTLSIPAPFLVGYDFNTFGMVSNVSVAHASQIIALFYDSKNSNLVFLGFDTSNNTFVGVIDGPTGVIVRSVVVSPAIVFPRGIFTDVTSFSATSRKFMTTVSFEEVFKPAHAFGVLIDVDTGKLEYIYDDWDKSYYELTNFQQWDGE
jgi:hypothetical protein